MNDMPEKSFERISLCIGSTIKLNVVNSENDTREFTIIEELGSGGTVIAYKVEYDGMDQNRYMYVLKELYPIPRPNDPFIERNDTSLAIDKYDVKSSHKYNIYRRRFEEAYRIQNEMATGEDAVQAVSTSIPIGLYEDRNSSSIGNYSIYGLFQYSVGHTLKKHKEKTLYELIDIQHKIAQVVKSYHDSGYLWFDIKEANVNIVGADAVQNVCMFDFGSLVSKERLMNYEYKNDPELVLSFSRSSSDLLLPKEIEALLPSMTDNNFGIVDMKVEEMLIQPLGNHGFQTDIFLLGSMLFKRLFGRAPIKTKEKDDCSALQDGSFEMGDSLWLGERHYEVALQLKRILAKCLNYDSRSQRYSDVEEYMADLNKVRLELCILDGNAIVEGDIRKYVTLCCNKYLDKTLTVDHGKFGHLKKLQGRFKSNVSMRSDKNNKQVTPIVAIDNAAPIESGERNNRLVFLYGDGGMGKSTALYDYMRETASVTPIYIELSQYNEDTSFIFNNIFEVVCNKFNDATGYIAEKKLKRAKDILKASLEVSDSNDSRPQYVLLLDGYNEIFKDYCNKFDKEIEDIIDKWNNCRIVITGRNLPTDDQGKLKSTYKCFSRFEFVGISEEERTSLIKAKYSERLEKIQRDKRLWDVLRIPMFMGMFLQINDDTTSVVHTRGEILEHFITKTEVAATNQISKGRSYKTENASLRTFVVHYGLPMIANTMDRQHTLNTNRFQLVNNVQRAWTVFDDNEGMKIGCMMEIDVPHKPSDFNKTVVHLLNVETGYCYKTYDGSYSFSHQYFRDYFAAKHIQNILIAAQSLGQNGLSKYEQLQFTKDNGLDYTWSDEVCIMLGEIIGDYKNEPGYTEE